MQSTDDRPPTYRITNWNDIYENNRTRELKRLAWVPVPNKMDGDGYTELVEGPDGAAHLGAWLAILEVASRCDPRGTLLRDSADPHTPQSLARISHLPAGLFEAVIPRLLKPRWLELTPSASTPYEFPQDTAGIPHQAATTPQNPAGIPHPPDSLARTRERNGTEGKGNEQNGTTVVSTKVVEQSLPTPPLPPLSDSKTKPTEPQAIAWLRESLTGFVQDCEAKTWVPPDDEICRRVLKAGNGASLGLIGQTLKELHRAGKRPELSWAWFETMITAQLNPPKMAKAATAEDLERLK
jgi:hypothetical protein